MIEAMMEAARLCALWLGLAAAGPGANIAAEVERLAGQRVVMAPDPTDGYTIEDIAGEGKPVVGVVERRGSHLYLLTKQGTIYRLDGRLARPRIAGPGYKIWALGPASGQAPDQVLTPRRIGVLARPTRAARQDQVAD